VAPAQRELPGTVANPYLPGANVTDLTHALDDHLVVDDTSHIPAPVDPAPTSAPESREVIPGWLRDPVARHAAIAWARQFAVHWALFHLARLPLYYARLAARAPVGVGRIIIAVCSWAVDAKGAEDRANLLYGVKPDPRSFVLHGDHHRRAIQWRTAALIVTATAAFFAGLSAWEQLSAPGQLAATVLSVVPLGMAGRRADRPITDAATMTAAAPRLSAGLIIEALSAAVPKVKQAVTRKPESLTFVAPITRDGKGWRADIQLPPGVTAGDVIKEREALASGLRRPESCVWPEADGSDQANAARLVLYVSDKPLASAEKVEWALAKKGRTNVFEPIPIGVDQRGRTVMVTLMYASGLIGAIPRMGKTFILRLLCLAAALDPRVELHLFNLKGGPDFKPLRHVAHTYRAGDDEADIDAALAALRLAQKDMQRRYAVLEELGDERCPEGKVTDELASDPELDLYPVLFAFDECQVGFEHAVHGKAFEKLVEDLVKRGPAVGYMVWLATQRPDAKSIPVGVRDNAVLRFCLKVIGYVANDMVLGTGMFSAGYQATAFARKDRGIALMAGEGDDPRIVRAAYVDGKLAEIISLRARAVRKAANRLTGLAAGQDPAPDDSSASIIDHLVDVWPAGKAKVHCETLANLLAERYPDTYGGWKAEQVTSAVSPHGIRSEQVKQGGVNRRGIAHAAVLEAAADRLLDAGEPEPKETAA
jgi:S-DNA-T family DNA segregation ATPase FtsK/SpoIIIE